MPPITIIYPATQWERWAGNEILADALRQAKSIADGRGQRIVGTDYKAAFEPGQASDGSEATRSITFEAGAAEGNPESANIPGHYVAMLPSAVKNAQRTVRVIDNPQGLAVSNGSTWISEVDGSDLGAGLDG